MNKKIIYTSLLFSTLLFAGSFVYPNKDSQNQSQINNVKEKNRSIMRMGKSEEWSFCFISKNQKQEICENPVWEKSGIWYRPCKGQFINSPTTSDKATGTYYTGEPIGWIAWFNGIKKFGKGNAPQSLKMGDVTIYRVGNPIASRQEARCSGDAYGGDYTNYNTRSIGYKVCYTKSDK